MTSRITSVAALAFFSLLAVAMGLYVTFWAIDFGGQPASHPLMLMAHPGNADAFAGMAEVAIGVLGIAITVVAILVELAANRYTPRIADLFVRDPVNIATLSLFLVTSLLVLWVQMSMAGPVFPRALVLVGLAAMTISFLLLLPYFAYVFAFLQPTNVVHRLQDRTTRALRRARTGRDLDRRRLEVTTHVAQLSDIALNAVQSQDKAIALAVVDAFTEIVTTTLTLKPQMPVEWFEPASLATNDPDFVSFHGSVVRSMARKHTWVEMKVLRQFEALMGLSLNHQRDVGHLTSIRTRQLAIEAAGRGDEAALELLLRFLNTYMRAAINARDVRTGYNLFNELRALAQALLDMNRDDRVLELASRMKYYGQLGFHAKLPFIQETTAYDLCFLLEVVSARDAACQDALLDLFLELDHQPEEGRTQEVSLRGVRKAQVKLATWYLAQGDERRARRIFEDLKREPPERLISIHNELASTLEPEYWEVSDRGVSFDWLPDPQRAQLATFFGWF